MTWNQGQVVIKMNHEKLSERVGQSSDYLLKISLNFMLTLEVSAAEKNGG